MPDDTNAGIPGNGMWLLQRNPNLKGSDTVKSLDTTCLLPFHHITLIDWIIDEHMKDSHTFPDIPSSVRALLSVFSTSPNKMMIERSACHPFYTHTSFFIISVAKFSLYFQIIPLDSEMESVAISHPLPTPSCSFLNVPSPMFFFLMYFLRVTFFLQFSLSLF